MFDKLPIYALTILDLDIYYIYEHIQLNWIYILNIKVKRPN